MFVFVLFLPFSMLLAKVLFNIALDLYICKKKFINVKFINVKYIPCIPHFFGCSVYHEMILYFVKDIYVSIVMVMDLFQSVSVIITSTDLYVMNSSLIHGVNKDCLIIMNDI